MFWCCFVCFRKESNPYLEEDLQLKVQPTPAQDKFRAMKPDTWSDLELVIPTPRLNDFLAPANANKVEELNVELKVRHK